MAGKQHVTNNATTLIVSACSFCCRPAKSCHWRCSTKPTACTGHTHTERDRKTQTACGAATLLLAWGGFISFWKKVARNYNIVGCATVRVCVWAGHKLRHVRWVRLLLLSRLSSPASLGKLRQTHTTHTEPHIYKLTLTHCYTHTHFIRFV